MNYKDKYFELRIPETDISRILKQKAIIERYIKNKKPIPTHIFEDFINRIFPLEDIEFNSFLDSSDSISGKMMEYFKPLKEYHFSINVRETGFPDGKKVLNRKETFESMIRTISFYAVQAKNSYKIRGSFSRNVYSRILNYISRYPELKPKFTQYKIEVIIGYLAYLLDYKSTNVLTECKIDNARPLTDYLARSVNKDLDSVNVFKNKK